jgi:hypothetical protein
MKEELANLEDELGMIESIHDRKYADLSLRIKELQENIKKTQIDTTNDIYERINRSMGITKQNGDIWIDLHSLHVNEAKTMLQEVYINLILVYLPCSSSIKTDFFDHWSRNPFEY